MVGFDLRRGTEAVKAAKESQRDQYDGRDAAAEDLAKSMDWNVTIGLNAHGRTALFDRWQGPWEPTARRVLANIGRARALIDSTGVGDPIVERLQKGRTNVLGFKFTPLSKQQLLEGLAGAIHRREITYPDGPIVHELEAFQYEYTASGVKYAAPNGMHDGHATVSGGHDAQIERGPAIASPVTGLRVSAG